jgi:hypothetical protein
VFPIDASEGFWLSPPHYNYIDLLKDEPYPIENMCAPKKYLGSKP